MSEMPREGAPTQPAPERSSIGDGPPSRIGPYEVLREIARGGMGIVYRARQADLGREVALKVMIAGASATPEFLARFQREARSAGRLDHPHVLPVFDVGQDGPLHYIVMPLIDGSSLGTLIRNGPIDPRGAMDLARKVALGLDHAHAAGVLHRDVKPGNILVDAQGEPHLADFGLAKDVAGVGITVPGEMLGTPTYASPEQVQGDVVDARSDVYSLGATLYHALTGAAPFSGSTAFEIVSQVLLEEPPPPRSIDPRLPADAETICARAMEKDPERRYPSAREMADDIARFLSGEPILARPASSLVRLRRRLFRNRPFVLSAAVAMLVIACVSVGVMLQSRHRTLEIRRGLDDAARLERKGDLAGARDALLGVLQQAPETTSARAALQRVDARIAECAAVASARTGQAAREAQAAEDAVEKARLVSSVLARWSRLAGPLAAMEAICHDARLPLDERRKRAEAPWKEVKGFLEATASDATSQSAARALAGWARRLAGFPDEGIEEIRAAATLDPDVPYGSLLAALVLFAEYAKLQPLPTLTESSEGGVEVGAAPGGEAREMSDIRERIESLLAGARNARVWGREGVEDFAGALAAVRAIQDGEYARAEEALTRALDAPDLRTFEAELVILRVKVRYLRAEFDSGLEDVRRARGLRPGEAFLAGMEGRLLRASALAIETTGKDPRPRFREAIAVYDDALAPQRNAIVDPGQELALHQTNVATRIDRGLTWIELAVAESLNGGDPREPYARGIADCKAAQAECPDSVEPWATAGSGYLGLATTQLQRGEDAREAYRQAIHDYGEALRLDPSDASVWSDRANAWWRLGEVEGARGADPRDSYRKAIADSNEAIRRNPKIMKVWRNRADAESRLAALDASLGTGSRELLAKAVADYGEALARDARNVEALSGRGVANQRFGAAATAEGKDGRHFFEAAIADYEKELQAYPSTQAWLNLASAWWGIGRGMDGKGEDSREVYRKAIEAFSSAIERDPSCWGATYCDRGSVRHSLGKAVTARGQDGREECARALADYDAALAAVPTLWQAPANKGQTLETLGRFEEAVAAYEQADRLCEGRSREVKAWLEAARKRANRK